MQAVPQTDAMVQIKNVAMSFVQGARQVWALDGVSLGVLRNEFFTLLGPSGCGKTTLLRLIAGFETPSAGEILLDGAPLQHLPPYKRPVNTVFQNYALFPHLSVADNIAFALVERRAARQEITRTVQEMLALVKLEGYGSRLPAQLSGGQQQRVALARALAAKPKVLLLDEPLSALDLKLRQDMRLELKRLQRETGITFVFVTHDQEEALTMSDRIAVMSAGRVQQVGTPPEIYDHPRNRFVADFIGDTNFVTLNATSNGLYWPDGALFLGIVTEKRGPVTVALRPERLVLHEDGTPATLTEIVYMGTDTVLHLRCKDTALQVRLPNRAGASQAWRVGDHVGVVFPEDATQMLEDAP